MDEVWLDEEKEYSINAVRPIWGDEREAETSRRSCCSLPKRFTRSMKPKVTYKEEPAAYGSPKQQLHESKSVVPPEQQDVLSQKNRVPPKRPKKVKRQPRGSHQLRRSRSWEKRHQANSKSRALASIEPNREIPFDSSMNLPGERAQPSYTKILPRVEGNTLKTQEILTYPGLTVSKIANEGQPRAEQKIEEAETKFGSMLLEVSVKKSLLERNSKRSWSDDDTLTTTVDDEGCDQEGKGDLDDLIDGVIFRLKNGDEKRTFGTPSRQVSPGNVQFVYDDGSFLETNCNIQRLAERKVGALVDEVGDEMETPWKATLVNFTDLRVESFASSVNEALDAFNCMQEDEQFTPSSIVASTGGTNKTTPLVKEFMAKRQGSKAVSPEPFGLSPLSPWERSPRSVAYDDESCTATYYDDDTLDDMYSLDDSYAYEHVKAFKDAARLLKTHAASQGLTGAQVVERIRAEQKRREWASMAKSR